MSTFIPIFTSNIPIFINNTSTMIDVSAQNLYLSGTLDVSDSSTFETTVANGLATFNNGINANNITVTNNFLVADDFSINNIGNTSIGGTIDVSGLATFNGGINADNFSVADGTGNVVIGAGGLSSDQLKVYGDVIIDGSLNVINNLTIQGNLNVQNSNHSYDKTTITSVNLDVCDNIIKINVKDTNLPSGIMVKNVSKNVFFGYSGKKEGQEHSDKFVITKTDYDQEPQSDISLSYDKQIDTFMNGSLNVSGTISGYGIGPIGSIIMWNGSNIPNGWVICDGTTVTGYGTVPDLRGRFIVGSSDTFSMHTSGGSSKITIDNLPPHLHDASANSAPQHRHSGETDISDIEHNHPIGISENSNNHDHQVDLTANGVGLYQRAPVNGDQRNVAQISAVVHNHEIEIDKNDYDHDHTATCTQTNPIHNHTFTTSQSGAYTPTISVSQTGSGTDYLQPYYVLAYIIRVI